MNRQNKFFNFSRFTRKGSLPTHRKCDGGRGYTGNWNVTSKVTPVEKRGMNETPWLLTVFRLGPLARRNWPQTNHKGSWENDKSSQILGWPLSHSADRTAHQSITYKWANRRGQWSAKTSGKGTDAWVLLVLPGNGGVTPPPTSQGHPQVQKEHALWKTLTGHRIQVWVICT